MKHIIILLLLLSSTIVYAQEGEAPALKKRFFPNQSQIVNGTKAILAGLTQGKKALVTQEEAEERAKICSVCPNNLHIGGCYSCSAAYNLVKRVFDRKTRYDHVLRVCSICGCLNAAQVHVTAKILKDSSKGMDAKDYPETNCWKRELLENG